VSAFVSPQGVNFLTVQVWVCDYGIGVGPKGGIASAGGSAGLKDRHALTLAAGGQASFSVRWTPDVNDLNIRTQQGKGHACIAANVFWKGTTPPPESDLLSGLDVLAICGDGAEGTGGHHGQHNIMIGPMTTGMPMINLDFNVFNLLRKRETFVVEVEEILGAGALGAAGREALLAERWIMLKGGKPGRVRPKHDHHGPLEPIERAKLRRGGRLVLRRGHRPIQIARKRVENPTLTGHGVDGKGPKVHVTVPGGRSQKIALQFPRPNESPGTAHVFDVTQRNRQGRVLGGARIIAVTRR
jgi:hypothetical protein